MKRFDGQVFNLGDKGERPNGQQEDIRQYRVTINRNGQLRDEIVLAGNFTDFCHWGFNPQELNADDRVTKVELLVA